MMMHVKYTQNNKLKWLPKHFPFCFVICSNISGYKQPYVYINEDMDELVDNMISYLNQMSAKSKLVCEKKWHFVFKQLNCKEEEWKDLLKKCEEYLEHNNTDQSDRDIYNVDDNTPDGLIWEYDTKSQSIIYKPNTMTNFYMYTTARKRSIAKSCKYAIESIKKLKVKFEQYVSRMPVLGFCSSIYDMILISKKLAMKMDLNKIGYVIKKKKTYLCMAV